MNHTKIPIQEFINSYQDNLGLEGTHSLLKQVISKIGIPDHQKEFTKEEALKICLELKQRSGFVGIIAGLLNSRIVIS